LRSFLKEKLPDYMIPAAFVLLDALPLTLNGKIDRRALPAPARVSDADATYVAPRTALELELAEIWAQVLRVDRVGVEDNFFSLGGDSLLSIQIVSRANQAGLALTIKQVFQHQTIAGLAAAVGSQPGIAADQGLVLGQVPLTPNQRWFFEQRLPVPQHWNLAMIFQTPSNLDTALLEQSVQQVLLHHDALRLRFVRQGAEWSQFVAPPDQVVAVTHIDLSKAPEAEQILAIEAAAANWQASLDLAEGPIMRVISFNCGSQRPGRLLVIIHHLVADKLSYDIVIEDIQAVYRQLSRGEAPQLSLKTTSFRQWAERLTTHEQLVHHSELAYWLALPWADVARLPVDFPDGRSANTEASARTLSVSLSVEATRILLQEIPRAFDVQVMDVLLSALVYTLAGWADSRVLLVEGAFNGRTPIFDDLDLSRTVGWLAIHPSILLDVRGAETPHRALQSIKAQLRRVPNYGIGQEILRYLSDDPAIRAQMQALPEPEVFFNFLGQQRQVSAQDVLLRPAHENIGLQHNPSGIRSRLLDCISGIVDDQLQLVWRYSAQVHQRSTIEALADSYLKVVQSLITAHR
jgi:non-ribosomal peptide synthase protein (TIGR01720 family)